MVKINLEALLKNLKKDYFLIIILFFALIGSVRLWQKLAFIEHTHFTDLAFSFLYGKLSLQEPIRYSSWQDSAYFGGKYYVYFGPIPAILLLPAVAIWGQAVSQQILTIIAGIINFSLLFRLAKIFRLKAADALWSTIALIFGSVYLFLSIVNISAYLIQIIGFTFLTASILEFFTKRRWALVGVFLALAGMTRPSLYFALPFFLLEIIQSKATNKKSALLLLILPIIISLITLGCYNQLRFGNPLDTGYAYNTTWPPGVREAVGYGLFSLKHLPGNLYFLLLKAPEAVRISNTSYILRFPFLKANEWGMSIFFTSPFFLFLFLANLKQKFILSSIITSLIGILPSLLYAGVGVWQYGYRYALDIYPFLFILLLSVFSRKGVTRLAKVVIIFSIIFNFWLLGSIWGVYPF